MLIARFLYHDRARFGILEKNEIQLLNDDIFNRIEPTGERVQCDRVQLLAPVEPGIIIGLGRNYHNHIKEMGMDPPDSPAVFFKPGRSIVSTGEPVVIPGWATR